jgi:AcrR family transcriptional regulator
MALADCASAFGAVLNLPPNSTTATIESKTNFLRKGSGPTVRAESIPLHIGRTMSVWRASIFRDEQIAEVTQTQLYLRENGAEAEGAQAPTPAAAEAPRGRRYRTALSQSFSQPIVDERCRQIFEGACAVIAKKGFAKASIREIAAAAGMPIPTMYQYLERKEDLLYQIYEYFMTDIVTALHQWRTAAVPPRERVEGVIRTMVELFDKHHRYIKLMFQETRALTPEARRRVYELDASYIAIIRELLDSAIGECGWKQRNAELAANFVYFLCCIWPLRHWTIGKFGQTAVAEEIVDFVLNGLSGAAEAQRQ